MKYPNHIILDMSKAFILNSPQYWLPNYSIYKLNNKNLMTLFLFHKKYLLFCKDHISLNKIILEQKIKTLSHVYTNDSFILYNDTIKQKLNKKNEINNFEMFFKKQKLWNLFDINFIKKEKIYTKLKYSRVPQYDIVSGGVAAIFAGFLGFLISEKFGIELVDSGDFYFLFMYVVFLCFFLRMFLKLVNDQTLSWVNVSFKWITYFYKIIFFLLLKKLNNFFFIIKKII